MMRLPPTTTDSSGFLNRIRRPVVHSFVDESGDPNYSDGASEVLLVASATCSSPGAIAGHLEELRCELAAEGVGAGTCFHAVDDSWQLRERVYDAIGQLDPDQVRFDITGLAKVNAFDRVRSAGPEYLYKMVHWLHWKEIAPRVAPHNGKLVVHAATVTKRKRGALHKQVGDVIDQVGYGLRYKTLFVDVAQSLPMQVADYVAWAAQRRAVRGETQWYDRIDHLVRTNFWPWGKP